MTVEDIKRIDKDFLGALLRYGRKNPSFYWEELDYDAITLDEDDVDDIIEGLKLLAEKRALDE